MVPREVLCALLLVCYGGFILWRCHLLGFGRVLHHNSFIFHGACFLRLILPKLYVLLEVVVHYLILVFVYDLLTLQSSRFQELFELVLVLLSRFSLEFIVMGRYFGLWFFLCSG